MLPLTLMAAQKLANLLTMNDALRQQVALIGQSCNLVIPPIASNQVVVTAAGPGLGDLDAQLTYPRVCIYSAGFKNSHIEKFRSLSGTMAITAEVWSSDNLITGADEWIHFYVEAVTGLLRQNVGDWGDGICFGGAYDVQLQAPKVGGLGYVESAKVNVTLTVSRN